GVLALCAACLAPGPTGMRRYTLGFLLIALAGVVTAAAQVWQQTASADQLIHFITRLEHVQSLLSQDMSIDRLRSDAMICAEITWT
ncbi:disulfide bond formation protein B, partial [Pseudomonas syringae pv. tagetis]